MTAKNLLTQFLDFYLVKRDVDAALGLLSEQVVSLGTGAQEVALNKAELRELMIHEFESIPAAFSMKSAITVSTGMRKMSGVPTAVF